MQSLLPYLVSLVQANPTISFGFAAFSFVAAVTAMAPAGTDGGGIYGWLYRFTHAFLPVAERVAIKGGLTVSHTETVTGNPPAQTRTVTDSTIVPANSAPTLAQTLLKS